MSELREKIVARIIDNGFVSIDTLDGYAITDAILALLPDDYARGYAADWPLGMPVTKIKGSSWTGKIVGYYSTSLTPQGLCIESVNEPGSVQIYPVAAIRALEPKP